MSNEFRHILYKLIDLLRSLTQTIIKDQTIERIEQITGKKFIRGGDRLINEAIDILQGKQLK